MMRKLVLFILAGLTSVSGPTRGGWAQENGATEILQRAMQAMGGERSLNGLKSPMMWMERGTFHGMGDGVPFVGQYAARWPSWYRQEIENAFAITTNGDKAWVTSAAGVQKLSGTQLEERLKLVRLAWAERLFPLQDPAYRLDKIDGIQVDGRETLGIKASRPGDRDIKLYFDKDTNLIAKIETMVISPQHGPQPVLSEAFYTDHKSFGGVKLPSKLKLIYAGKLFFESETIDYKLAATLDPQQFEMPE